MLRGISYAVSHRPEVVREVARTLRDDLHADAVMLIDRDPDTLRDAARIALQEGLAVWIRPSLEDATEADLLAHLRRVASDAETLRREHPGRVTLLVGTEFSLTTRVVLPGRWTLARLQIIIRARRVFDRRITRRLDRLLAATVEVARDHFAGPLSYGAAYWERVDWSRFDVVGVNLYRIGLDRAAYDADLDRRIEEAHAADKPFVVTEFGCGAFVDAERWGPGGFLIVKWFSDPPRVRDGHDRDESVQAAHLGELIDLYDRHRTDGCFVFTFSMTDFPRSDDPEHDLDRAGFGIVSVDPERPDTWTPKQAFAAVAERYARLG